MYQPMTWKFSMLLSKRPPVGDVIPHHILDMVHFNITTAILIPCRWWFICAALSNVRICGIPLYPPWLQVSPLSTSFVHQLHGFCFWGGYYEYSAEWLCESYVHWPSFSLHRSYWHSQLWSSLRLYMITVSDPCLCIYSCWIKVNLDSPYILERGTPHIRCHDTRKFDRLTISLDRIYLGEWSLSRANYMF